MNQASLLDFLVECQQGKMSRSTKPGSMMMFKALVFMAKHAQLESLQSCLQMQAVKALGAHKPSEVKKKDAWPLPFDLVVKMESLVNDPGTAPWTVLLLGFFLVCIWASLREADARRSSTLQLSVDNTALRGVAWQSKSSKVGHAWGVRSLGFVGQPPSMGLGPQLASQAFGMAATTGPSWHPQRGD